MNMEMKVAELFEELVQIRRDLHRHPELGMEERRTTDTICSHLERWGIPYKTFNSMPGVLGLIEGGVTDGSKTVALRADIDALPIQEDSPAEYRSVWDGKMHACGHDIHTTIQLGAAKILHDLGIELGGRVKLLFQPAEETTGGALPMIQAGCLDDPEVDCIFGLHVAPAIDTGKVELKYGMLNAASDTVSITVKGLGGHGAYPDLATDAIVAAGHIITALQTLVSRNISPLNSCVLSLGAIQGGTRGNIICDEVTMTGTLRTLDEATRHYAEERIRTIAVSLAVSLGCTATVTITRGYDALINNSDMVDLLHETARKTLGADHIVFKEKPSLGVEDFSYFSNRVPGAFYHLGCRKDGLTTALHRSNFDVDERCIITGVLLQVESTLRALRSL